MLKVFIKSTFYKDLEIGGNYERNIILSKGR